MQVQNRDLTYRTLKHSLRVSLPSQAQVHPVKVKRGKRYAEILHPMLRIYDMAKYLLNSEKHSEKLLGHPLSLEAEWSRDLVQFWEKWKCVEPSNPIYVERSNDLRYCVPCMLHGDEGVGHRRKPVMQLSWGSLLRVSYSSLERMFLITSCPHKMYSKLNKGASAGNFVLDRLLEECAKSALRSYMGIETSSGHTFDLVFLGVAGDHPFQTKAYRSQRGHLKVDICPHCHANTYSVPFEDMSLEAMWRKSVFQSVPWNRKALPPLRLMPGALDPSFIRWDLMHMLPHGCARNYVASAICMMAGPLDMFISPFGLRDSKDARLEEAYTYFKSWLDATKQHVRDMKEFTKENLGWEQNRCFPDMKCKASDCNLLIKRLIDFLTSVPFKRDWVLETTLNGLIGIDEFSRLSYTGDRIFWDKTKQMQGKSYIGMFLRAYVDLQEHWFQKQWTLFNLVPKLHYSAHWHESLKVSLEDGKAWALSPGAFATPLLEDFIGVVSRISRTSHPSSVPRTTIFKYLVQVRKAWSESKRHPQLKKEGSCRNMLSYNS